MFLSDFFHLFIPRICPACENPVLKREKILCMSCRYLLPKTNYHLLRDNPVERLFWGRVNISVASCFYFFQKQGKVQQMLHCFKYKGNREIGLELGKTYGKDLLLQDEFKRNQVIIPVPLHHEKRRIRGYNQSEVFAEGLAGSMKLPISADNLKRKNNSASQTRKTRYKRWENVEHVFFLDAPEKVNGLRVLLVDDVVTTGATLEACAIQLFNAGADSVSIACIASAI